MRHGSNDPQESHDTSDEPERDDGSLADHNLVDHRLFDELREVQKVRAERREHSEVVASIPGYRIIREVRRGGQGVIYEAVQSSTGRRVAVKVLLHAAFSYPRIRRRFQREVELLATLRHPSIVTLFESGEMNGTPFYTMEFIDGTPLNQTAALRLPDSRGERPEHLRRVLQTSAIISEAVACFQQFGLIHRDLKPENILIDSAGSPRIVDFGLARLADPSHASGAATEENGMTLTGEFLGTPAYAAPEQVLEGGSSVDLRSDVYALGVILYELLTGVLPVSPGRTIAETLQRIVDQEPVRPSLRNASIDRDTETIILKCLSKDPIRRYQSAAELAADFHRRLEGRVISARSDSTWYVIRRSLRRHTTVLGILAFCGVVLMAAATTVLLLWRQAVQDRNEAQAELYRASLHAAFSAQREDRIQDALDLLQSPEPRWRGWEWHYVLSRIDHSVRFVRLTSGMLQQAACSPDRKHLALVETSGQLTMISTESGRSLNLKQANSSAPTGSASFPQVVAFRPAHQELLVCGVGGDAWLLDYQHDVRHHLTGIPAGSIHAAGWDATGEHLVLAVETAAPAVEVCWWSAARQMVTERQPASDGVRALAVTADAGRVVVAGRTISVLDRAGKESAPGLIDQLSPKSACITAALSPDEQCFAVGMNDGAVRLYDTASGSLLRILEGHGGSVQTVAFSEDSRMLASGSQDSVTRLWDVASGKPIRSLHGHLHWILGTWFPDASTVASVSSRGELKYFVTDRSPDDRSLPGHDSVVTGLQFDASGGTLVSASLDGHVRSHSVAADAPTTEWIDGVYPITCVATGSDTRWMVAGREDGRLLLAAGGQQRTLKPGDGGGAIHAVAISPGDQSLIVGTDSGAVLMSQSGVPSRADGPPSTARSKDLSWVAERSFREIGRHQRPVRFAGFAAGGRLLITEDESAIQIRELPTGVLIRELSRPLSRYYCPVAIDENHDLLVAGDSAGRINVWDIRSGAEVAPFQWHSSSVTAVCFSPDGSRLMSAATDGALKVWDVSRRREVFAVPDVSGFVNRLAFSPDGRRMAAGLYDGTLILYEALPAARRLSGPARH